MLGKSSVKCKNRTHVRYYKHCERHSWGSYKSYSSISCMNSSYSVVENRGPNMTNQNSKRGPWHMLTTERKKSYVHTTFAKGQMSRVR